MTRGTTKKRTPFVIDRDGKELFVEMRYSGIHPLVVMVDGLTLIFFGSGKKAYLRVEDAIRWHEKELKDTHGQSGNRVTLEALQKALATFNGRGEEEGDHGEL